MGTWRLASLLCLLSPASPGDQQQGLRPRFAGQVLTSSGPGLAGAEVTVIELSRTVTSDTLGRFIVDSLAPGQYTVRVRRIGFRIQWLALRLQPGDRKDITIVMESAPVRLPDVEVTAGWAKPAEYAYTHKYDDFFRRKHIGLGAYISRETSKSSARSIRPDFFHSLRVSLLCSRRIRTWM